MKLIQVFSVTTVASAAALMCASAAQAVTFSGFEGTSLLDNAAYGQPFRPPDTMGAVETTQFMETTNGTITVYDKASGNILQRSGAPTWWGAAGLPGGAGGDQRVLFDHHTNRWIASGFGATGNIINIAVSDTADALGRWKSTQIIGAVGTTLDYPTLAIDQKGVYIGTNNFSSTGFFKGTSLFTIPKSSLFGGAPNTAGISSFNTPYPGGSDNGFAILAAVNWGANPNNTASVMADSRDFNAQVFYKLNGVNGPGATQTAAGYIAGAEYEAAGPARQPDGTRVVDTLGPRISSNVVQVDDKLYSVTTVGIGVHAAVRWSVNDADTGAIIDTGYIKGHGFDYYQGSIAVNELGQAVIGFNRSGYQTEDTNGDGLADGNISFLARTFKTEADGGLDKSGADVLFKVSGISDYHCSERVDPLPCRQRWGDYSAVTIDPTDHRSFYAIGEYTSQWATYNIPDVGLVNRAIWNTYIGQVSFVPEPQVYAMMLLGLAVVGGVARRRRG